MASRALTAAMAAEIQAAKLYPVLFFEGEFYSTGSPDAQFLRLFTGVGSLAWDAKTWTGAGRLLAISDIAERSTIEAIGFNVTLSGMPSSDISLALQSIRQGKPGKIWLGAMDASGNLIADPYLIGQGKFDTVQIEDGGESCTISVNYESRLIDLLRPRVRRYTNEDQQIDYPSDVGFEYVPSLQDMQLIWGGPGAGASLIGPFPSNPDEGPPTQTGGD